MNMRIPMPITLAAPPGAAADQARGAAPVQAAVVPIADAVAALIFETGPGARSVGAGRLGGSVGGRSLPRPVVSTRLPLCSGGLRHVLLIGASAERLARTPSLLDLDGVPAAAIDPDWLQSPLVEPAALIDGLTEDGRRRLLRMLTTTAASLLGGGAGSGFGAAVRRVLTLLSAPELRAYSICALGAEARLLSFRLPFALETPDIETLVALSDDRATRIAGFAASIERNPRGRLLHLIVPEAPGARTLVGLGAAPLVLSGAPEAALQPLAPWLARRAEATRDWVAEAVGEFAADDPTAGALARELRHAGAAPALVVRHLSATPAGALIHVELDDPHALVVAVRVEADGFAADLRPSARDRLIGGAIALGGFFAAPAPAKGDGIWRFRLIWGSGRVHTVAEQAPLAYDGAIPAGIARLGRAEAAEALATARLGLGRPAAEPVVDTIGAQPRKPMLSLVVAAGCDPDVIRARAALIFAEPGAGAVEIVYHTGAAQAEAVEQVLAGCHGVFGQGCRLVILSDAADAAARLRAALKVARGAAALALGADVLPAAPGWLAAWSAALSNSGAPALLGGALLSADGAILDAGGALTAKGTAERRWRGLPVRELPAARFAPTDLVSADCAGLKRRAIKALGAVAWHYPDADVLLAGLARRLRRGRSPSATFLDGRFIRFGKARVADPLGTAIEAGATAMAVRRAKAQGDR